VPRWSDLFPDVLDVTGRRVRRLASGLQDAGLREVTWDARDEGGRSVSAGVYFVRLRGEGLEASRKILRLP
jgi:flagellar hook assembly protein FlgD